MKRATKLDTTELTTSQYRYLKESMYLLHRNGLAHGDLIDNVMLAGELPVIIDWDTAVLKSENEERFETVKRVDVGAFFSSSHFKCKQRGEYKSQALGPERKNTRRT